MPTHTIFGTCFTRSGSKDRTAAVVVAKESQRTPRIYADRLPDGTRCTNPTATRFVAGGCRDKRAQPPISALPKPNDANSLQHNLLLRLTSRSSAASRVHHAPRDPLVSSEDSGVHPLRRLETQPHVQRSILVPNPKSKILHPLVSSKRLGTPAPQKRSHADPCCLVRARVGP